MEEKVGMEKEELVCVWWWDGVGGSTRGGPAQPLPRHEEEQQQLLNSPPQDLKNCAPVGAQTIPNPFAPGNKNL